MTWELDLGGTGRTSSADVAGENRLTETDRLAHLGIWFDLASNLVELPRGVRRWFRAQRVMKGSGTDD